MTTATTNKPCAKPFRELSINWDGTVSHCCIAWAGEMRCGSAATDDLGALWNGPRFDAVRRKLLLGLRDFGTCKGCNHPSYRTALLPDKLGRKRAAYPPPDGETERLLAEMDAEGPQTQQHPLYVERKTT